MTKRPLSRNEFEQTKGAQRPPVVAPGGRSRLREPPVGVAARRRSGSLRVALRERPRCVAPVTSLRVALRERPRCVAPVTSLRAMETRATLGCRSERLSQRLHGVAPVRSLLCTARPMITFITSFELQMLPNVSKNSMWYSNT
ncbi:hypothetical protein F2Q69_00007616 [Brassica cretica]|uniref:Uncharacterized protein n=1 Tax=Brassica cretica TaxID=69181 RepID=A0A8S9P283_BRACR|nr:hypothetical protein F2Q69_00007616 [Brassica cretica]